MKLYFASGACSLSLHIVLLETELKFDLVQVDLGKKKTDSGQDYYEINPKGNVPALRLNDGQILTEGPAIVQYLADQVPEKKLAPPAGTMERYRLMEWLNMITSDLHTGFGLMFNKKMAEECKEIIHAKLITRLDWLNKKLEKMPYLMGDSFTVADAYLFTILGWSEYVGIKLSRWSFLQAYGDRIGARPTVQEAIMTERLKSSY